MCVVTETRKAGAPAMETIKLSEAIREGAKLRPQCTGYPFQAGHSCALGAAWEYLNGRYPDPDEEGSDYFQDSVSEFIRRRGIPPELITKIWQKNDFHEESREAIADWLEGQGL